MSSLFLMLSSSVRKLFKSQKYSIRLRDKLHLLQNAFSSTTTSDSNPEVNTFTTSYLIESLGLTKKTAESISRRVNFKEKANADSVLKLLRSHGFKDSQISTIITASPQLLISDSEKSLLPKLKLLQSFGDSSSEFTEIVSKVPKILEKKFEKSVSLYYDIVKDMMLEGKICYGRPQGRAVNKIRNLSVLIDLGVPHRLLFPLLITNAPIPFCGKEKFEETLKRVVEMGFDPTKSTFMEAFCVIYEMRNETLEEKVEVCKRLGFVENDVWVMFMKWPFVLKLSEEKVIRMFDGLKKFGLVEKEIVSVLKVRPQLLGVSEERMLDSYETFLGLGFSRDELKVMVKRHPPCLGYSLETVKKKIEFVVTEMNWPLGSVVMIPAVLGYSLEKRTMPRCAVIKVLMSKGLIASDENPPLASVLTCSDKLFLKRYVWKHDELAPELMAILTGDHGSPLRR